MVQNNFTTMNKNKLIDTGIWKEKHSLNTIMSSILME
jgi:hypothetical protein